MTIEQEKIIYYYFLAKKIVIRKGFLNEIIWQDNLCLNKLSEKELLKQFAWVVLSSGMKESIIVAKFDELSKVFFNWQNATDIYKNTGYCKENALKIFNHKGKINAIIAFAEFIHKNSFKNVIELIYNKKIEFIMTFSYMGPATSYHLAKNIGLEVAKPDRHLKYIAFRFGYNSPHDLCLFISSITGEKVSVVEFNNMAISNFI